MQALDLADELAFAIQYSPAGQLESQQLCHMVCAWQEVLFCLNRFCEQAACANDQQSFTVSSATQHF